MRRADDFIDSEEKAHAHARLSLAVGLVGFRRIFCRASSDWSLYHKCAVTDCLLGHFVGTLRCAYFCLKRHGTAVGTRLSRYVQLL